MLNGSTAKYFSLNGIAQAVILLLLVFFGSNVIDNGKTLVKLTTVSEITTVYFEDHEARIRSLELMRYRSYSYNENHNGDS